MEDPDLSIIVPSVRDAAALVSCYETISGQIDHKHYRWEMIYVDHGISELAWIAIHHLLKRDPDHVRAFIFSQNQERSHALALGYREARGELIFTLELDLDDDPGEVVGFLARIAWEPTPWKGGRVGNSQKTILQRGISRRAPRHLAAAR